MYKGLYETWRERDPRWAKRFKQTLLERFSNYSTGSEKTAEAKGKIFGAGYELFIIAFFIGLYSNQKRRLPEGEKGHFGVLIKDWGNSSGKILGNYTRKRFNELTEYMFIALITRCPEIDFIELDKGNLDVAEVASILTHTMEQYANYGFQYLSDIYAKDSELLFREGAFFDIIDNLVSAPKTEDDDVPEPL